MKITKNQLKRIIKEEISKVLSEDEEERGTGALHPGVVQHTTHSGQAPLEQYIADNPLHGIPPKMSLAVFVMQLRAGVYGRVGSFEEAKDAYDHLRRTLDPNDTSHLHE